MILRPKDALRLIRMTSVEEEQVGSLSIDLTLESAESPDFESHDVENIASMERLLGFAQEEITMSNNLAALLTGRSSDMRRGLVTPCGWIHPGFKGRIRLEFFNISRRSIPLETGQRVAQLVFFETTEGGTYDGQYQNQ